MPRIITTTCLCLLASLAIAQIDSSSLDSLSRRIDSSTRASKAYNDSLIKMGNEYYDSVMSAQTLEQMDRNRDALIATMKEREEQQRRNAYIRIAIGIAGFGLLIFSFIRNRKRKKEQEARGGKV